MPRCSVDPSGVPVMPLMFGEVDPISEGFVQGLTRVLSARR